jgi:uncharacterized protein YdhG (YjbR/CyaY superfamily)
MSKAKSTTKQAPKSGKGLSDFEKAAMKDRLRELKAEERMNSDRAAGEKAILDRIATMPEPDRSLAKRVHKIVTETAPELMPKTWSGMPAYTKTGKVLIFFQDAKKFEARYSTVGFTDTANLDDGDMWATSFALAKLSPAEEAKIVALLKKALR